MSQWTHVAGIIRYDGNADFPHIRKGYIEALEKNVPKGSEGPLEWRIWDNPDLDSMAAYVVTIWGDLRDFYEHDLDTLELWFRQCVEPENFLVRMAILLADTGSRCRIWRAIERDEGGCDVHMVDLPL